MPVTDDDIAQAIEEVVARYDLTDKEHDILVAMMSGQTSSISIATAIGMGEQNVRNRMLQMMKKTGTFDRAGLLVRVLRGS